MFQSPRGDFGFLKPDHHQAVGHTLPPCVSIPSRGFWFFEAINLVRPPSDIHEYVSIPSRGFWFFEDAHPTRRWSIDAYTNRFNPLAGILVF